jgi:archaellum biogenesis ATPase FlaH
MPFEVDDDLDPTEISDRVWIWKNWLPHYQVTLLSGDSAAGKSRGLASILGFFVREEPYPDGLYSDVKPSSIFLINTESDKQEVIETYVAQGWDEKDLLKLKVIRHFINPKGDRESFDIDSPAHYTELIAMIKKWQPSVIIFDPLVEFHRRNDISSKDIRALMMKLAHIAQHYKVAIVVISHWNKNEKQSNANRNAGSHQFLAAVRSAITVYREKDDLRVWHHQKTSIGKEQDDLGYTIAEPDGMVLWGKKADSPESSDSKVYQAEKWIREQLVKFNSIQVSEAYKVCGFNERTLRRARHNIDPDVCTVWKMTAFKQEAFWELKSEKNIWGHGKLSTSAPGSPPQL